MIKFAGVVFLLGLGIASAWAQTGPSVSIVDAEQKIAQLQSEITQLTARGKLSPPAVDAVSAKQQELENLAAKIKSHSPVTPDEHEALLKAVEDQDARIKKFASVTEPQQTKTVDPSSVPPPLAVMPNGETIVTPGANPTATVQPTIPTTVINTVPMQTAP